MNTYRICASIDLDAFTHNIRAIQSKLSPGTKLMGVIKTNAYGHGALVLAEQLEKLGAGALAVACADEGIELRLGGIKLPILILGQTVPEQYDALMEYDITPTVFTPEMALAMNEAAAKRDTVLPVHIKLDTGMGRIGFLPDAKTVEEILAIGQLPHLKVEGMFTHLACADMAGETAKKETSDQFLAYQWVNDQLFAKGMVIPIHHVANSAGIMEGPGLHWDMVRAGIIMYGLYPSDEVDRSIIDLQPVLSLHSQVSFVKTVPEGTGISYGHTYVTDRETVVATVPVGYGDGYPRVLSNKSSVLIRGQRARVIGRVCMDQLMVDVTHIPGVRIGDAVTLIGSDGDETVSADELAVMADTIHYELMCGLGRRVPREYRMDGRVIRTDTYLNIPS